MNRGILYATAALLACSTTLPASADDHTLVRLAASSRRSGAPPAPSAPGSPNSQSPDRPAPPPGRNPNNAPSNPPPSATDQAACARSDNPDAAIDACTRLILRNQKEGLAYRYRGIAFLIKQNYGLAIADFGEAIRINPGDVDSYNGRGSAYLGDDDYDRAIADFNEVVKLRPTTSGALVNRGTAYFAKNDYDRAIADFKSAIRLDPKDALARRNRGDAYAATHSYDLALSDYNEAIRLDPRNPRAYAKRGSIYKEQGDFVRAIADYDDALKLDPKNAAAYRSRGYAYHAKGDYERAIADFNEALTINPKDAAGYRLRGNAYLSTSEYALAIADYDEALLLDPALGEASQNRERARQALASLQTPPSSSPPPSSPPEHSPQQTPPSQVSSIPLGDSDTCSRPAEKGGEAVAACSRLISANPNDADSFFNRGWAYDATGSHDVAIVDFDEAIRLRPGFAKAYAGRGNAYLSKGEYALAVMDYDEALHLDPALGEAIQNRERARQALAAAAPPDAGNQPQSPHASADAPAAPPERRVALVIGNSKYRAVPPLLHPQRDAEAVADALQQAGFQTVMLKSDLDRDAMHAALRAFRAEADNADWALIYYAGHGLQAGNVNYFVPVNAMLSDVRDISDETISYGELVNTVSGAKAVRILVLDASRPDPFETNMVPVRNREISQRGLTAPPPATPPAHGLGAPPTPEPGMLVVFAAKDGQAAEEGDGANSTFALALAARLKTRGRQVGQVFDAVRDDVLHATGGRQQPYTYGSLREGRDYVFVQAK